MAWERSVWPDARLVRGARVRTPNGKETWAVADRDEYMMVGEVVVEDTRNGRTFRTNGDNLEVFVADPPIDPGPSYWSQRAQELASMS
jgi:hypothetical protein